MDSLRRSQSPILDLRKPAENRAVFPSAPQKPPVRPEASRSAIRPNMANMPAPPERPKKIQQYPDRAYISENKVEKPKRKNGPLFFSIALFLMIAIFAAIIGWYEFKNGDNSLEKILSKSNATTEKATRLETEAKAANAAKAAQAQAAQQKQTVPAETTPVETENLNTGATNPAETADSENGEKEAYKNEKEGVSFDHTSDYKITESSGQIVATKADVMWRMKVYDNKDKKEIQEWFDAYFSGKDVAGCSASDPATLKIGTLATKLMKAAETDGKCEGVGYYALNSDKTKVVRVRLDKADETEANKILSSFKFLK